MGLSDAWFVAQQWGPVAGPALIVLAFFLWKDWRREDRLQKRIEKLEQSQEKVLIPMLEKCTEVIAKNTTVLSQLGQMLPTVVCKFEKS